MSRKTATEYATQMMGIGEYSEKWNYPDKVTFNLIVKSYMAGESRPKDESEPPASSKEETVNENGGKNESRKKCRSM